MSSPADYDFELPLEQIAQQPAAERRLARLLVLRGEGVEHRRVAELPELLAALEPAPLMVVNDSRVVPARVHAQREGGKRFELLIVDPGRREPGDRVHAWVRGAKKLAIGEPLQVDGLVLRYLGRDARDGRACTFEVVEGELLAALESRGELPLPPYIARPSGPSFDDLERYQTVFARERGSVAAPTAGLHLDRETLARLDHVSITLHVGPGTFLPMEAADVREHRVGAERFSISADAAARIEAARAEGRPILAVGTTVTRTLESVALAHGGRVVAGAGSTELVITPDHRFAVVNMLMTNFHLPRSSLLMLVCSFAGRERVLAAYREAVAAGYRFYSYGDAMLILART
ncbi:MAG TPA: tRNA preQ1(34) S-adenosylmethionine ribosyltransferase-isomerase QueA [Enhygromyxa sp.]|nr:tRNA preQ1(34) S-adenosylmethionine ribosyltransferase-isomerase QueA [Enhygromyxa sp.]